jgi:hypothetical protein
MISRNHSSVAESKVFRQDSPGPGRALLARDLTAKKTQLQGGVLRIEDCSSPHKTKTSLKRQNIVSNLHVYKCNTRSFG